MSLKAQLISVSDRTMNENIRSTAPMPTDRIDSKDVVLFTARAFNRKSFYALCRAIKSGVFGMRSPRSFFLEVSHTSDEDLAPGRMVIYSPVFLPRKGKDGIQVTYVPNKYLARDLGDCERMFIVVTQ